MNDAIGMTDLRFVTLHTGGELIGDNVEFTGVSTDTRKLREGELFVALSGPNFDGHDFIADAAAAGAVGLLTDRQVESELSQLVVADTLKALADFATAWRGEFFIPVIGVTGSTGKTTCKQMIAAILAERGEVLFTEGNLNNDIGVPLTLLRLRGGHRFAVIEMGANHVGEIARLASIARPDIGLVTNAGEAHLEGFGGIDGVVEGKGEMFAGVVDGGVCIINGDQPWSDDWKHRAGVRRKLMFGIGAPNDFHVDETVSETETGLSFRMRTPIGTVDIALPLHGRHNVMNALAAAAAAWIAGADLEAIAQGLGKVANVGGRMQIEKLSDGVTLVDDTYNANPLSMRAAIEWLAGSNRRGWLIMGDMGELGPDALAMHEEIGAYANYRGIERVYCVGELSAAACAVVENGQAFDNVEQLVERVRADLEPGVTLLVKGSRAARMERVLAGLRDRDGRAS